MLRRLLAACALAALAGCQDYNFNPVGKCVLQPGSAKIQLSSVSTADILFVVDDSGSMAVHQQSLAANFKVFIDSLAQTQAERKQAGLDALDFHIAITSSSVFEGQVPSSAQTCGQTTAGTCSVANPTNAWTSPYTYACTGGPTEVCADLITSVWVPQCGTQGKAYPQGDFVAAAGNAPVLHFTKDLNWETWGTATPDPNITSLIAQFQANINVGTCGSGMEQHLESGRLAVKKSLQQDGLKQPAAVDPKEWPHPGAKMVVVWIGDEDDCSNGGNAGKLPKDPNQILAFTPATNSPGSDVCIAEEQKAATGQPSKLFPVQQYADFFTGLDRLFSAAFIYSAVNCRLDDKGNIVCDAGTCSSGPTACNAATPDQCLGKSNGTRFHDLSAALRGKGAQTLDASVCDPDFGKTIKNIAQLVKPPSGLTLPSQPATTEVAVLGIQGTDGQLARTCTGPGTDLDWTFVDCRSGQPVAAGVTTSCITINHATHHCEANPGESYVAQYLGLVPPPSTSNPQGGCATVSDCTAALGGTSADWTCQTSGQARGTCLCVSPSP